MMMPPTEAMQEKLGESAKSILNTISNKHLVGYIEKGDLYNDFMVKQATTLTIFSGLTLLSHFRSDNGIISSDEKAVVKKKIIEEKRILKTAGFTKFKIAQNKVITLK